MTQRAIRNDSIWQQYKDLVVNSFRQMPRQQQESVIRTNCAAVSIGVGVVIANAVYYLVPAWVRLIGVPLLIIAGFQSGKKVLAPFVIKQMESHLNPPAT